LFVSVSGAFLLLCGIRGVNLSPISHPFSHEIKRVWSNLNGSIFFSREYPFLAPLTPIFVLSFLGGSVVMGWFLKTGSSITGYGLGGILCLFLFILLIQFLILLSFYFVEVLSPILSRIARIKRRPSKRKPRWKKKEEKQVEMRRIKDLSEQAEIREEYENLSSVVCTGKPLKPSLDALPKEKRTIYLRFLDLKKKVCKPFAE
jgi:hypothetical protein